MPYFEHEFHLLITNCITNFTLANSENLSREKQKNNKKKQKNEEKKTKSLHFGCLLFERQIERKNRNSIIVHYPICIIKSMFYYLKFSKMKIVNYIKLI